MVKKKVRTFLRFITQIYDDCETSVMARHESQVVLSHADFYKTFPSNQGHFWGMILHVVIIDPWLC